MKYMYILVSFILYEILGTNISFKRNLYNIASKLDEPDKQDTAGEVGMNS